MLSFLLCHCGTFMALRRNKIEKRFTLAISEFPKLNNVSLNLCKYHSRTSLKAQMYLHIAVENN